MYYTAVSLQPGQSLKLVFTNLEMILSMLILNSEGIFTQISAVVANLKIYVFYFRILQSTNSADQNHVD